MYLVAYDTVFGICHESGRVFLTRASALKLATERAAEADQAEFHDRVGIVRARFSIRDCLRFGWRHAWTLAPETTIVWIPDTRPHPSDCICLECTNDPIDLYGDF